MKPFFDTALQPLDLALHAKTYGFDKPKFQKLQSALFQKIQRYDESYGPYLESHLQRVSDQLAQVLNAYGLDAQTTENIQNAFSIHDVGKVLQPIALWRLSPEKPTEEVKERRKEHVVLARKIIEDTIQEMGFDFSSQADEKHLKTIFYLANAHHERLCGKGPFGFRGNELDPVLRIATIIDEADGKYKTSKDMTLLDIFEILKSDKHKGQFDIELIDLCERVLTKDTSPINTAPLSTACTLKG